MSGSGVAAEFAWTGSTAAGLPVGLHCAGWTDSSTGRGATGPAVLLAKEAVRTIERLRAGVRDIDGGRLDFAFAEDRQDAYRFLADELFALGRLPEAMDVLGLLKASELDAFAVRGRANAAGTAADPVPTVPSEAPLEERFAAVRDELTARGAELAALRTTIRRLTRPSEPTST